MQHRATRWRLREWTVLRFKPDPNWPLIETYTARGQVQQKDRPASLLYSYELGLWVTYWVQACSYLNDAITHCGRRIIQSLIYVLCNQSDLDEQFFAELSASL
jgi:hypothetical protein